MSNNLKHNEELPKGSIYLLWVLVGIYLGYKLVPDQNRPRMYNFVNRDGVVEKGLDVHGSAIRDLEARNLIGKSRVSKTPILSAKGFDYADDFVKAAGGSIYKDSSVHIG